MEVTQGANLLEEHPRPRDEPRLREDNPKIKDSQILHYLWTVVEKYREREEHNSIQCLLCEQKLVHLTLLLKEREPQLKVPYEVKEEIVGLVQKINRMAMENIKDQAQSCSNAKFIAKAVDLVMLPETALLVSGNTLTRLKILTFNNLACVLKKNRHYVTALKAVSFSLDLEQQLLDSDPNHHQYDIVATYLNKAAILSDMGNHGKALEQIRRARSFAERIEKELEKKLKTSEDSEEGRQLQQKKHYGLYMKMLINYSIGVEKEHQKLLSSAVSYYQESKRLAICIGNQFMATKLQAIILKLKKQ